MESKKNGRGRGIVMAGLFLVMGALLFAPSVSAVYVDGGSGGCTGNLVSDLGSNPTWENLFGDVGRFVDCVSFGSADASVQLDAIVE